MALICCLFVLPLVGCGGSDEWQDKLSGSISMQVVAGRSSISQNFAFPAGVKQLSEDVEQEKIDAYISDLENQIRLKVWNRMFLNYFAVYSQNPNNEFLIGGENVDFKQAAYNRTTDKVEFSFNFKSYAAWNYYHPKSESGEGEQTGDENLFLDINETQGAFPFSQQTENDGRVGEIYAKIISDVQEAHFSEAERENITKPGFSYEYVTIHKRVHSNADYVVNENDYYRHIWQCEFDGLGSGKTVELKTVNANRGWWYLVALASAIGVAGITCGGIYIAGRTKKAKNQNKKKD